MHQTYSFDYSTSLDAQTMILIFTIGGVLSLIAIIAQWKIFTKAGKPGWASLIPIYNFYVLLKIVGKRGWYMLWLFVPIVNFIVGIKVVHYLSKSFGKDAGFTLGLLFLGFIFYPLLAFSDARYIGPYADRNAFEAYKNQNDFEFDQRH